MKKIFINSVILCFILMFFIISLSGCSSEDKTLESKAESKIDHINDNIISMMNKLNQINFSNVILVEEPYETQKTSTKGSSSEGQDKKSESSSSEGQDNKSESSSSDEGQSSEEESTSEDPQSESSKNNDKSNSGTNIKYTLENNSILTNNNNKEIDWNYLKNSIETINVDWNRMIIDLHALNISNDDILNFSTLLNQTTISIKDEKKQETLVNLANLYAYLPNYLKECSSNEEKINIEVIKSSILNSYVLVEQDKWDDMKIQVSNAISAVNMIMNRINSSNNNYINNIYIMLNELNNTLDLKDKDLYYMKYKNLMKELMKY